MGVSVTATAMMAVAELKPYGKNPRRGDVGAIKRSLEAHGQFRALVVRAGTNEVLAGNHTLAAMLELGWTEALVGTVDVSDDEAARIVLVDNRASDLGSQDDDLLVGLLQSLPDLDGTGYDAAALAELVGDFQPMPEDSQPRLDQRAPVRCPECGHEFVPGS